MESVITNEPGYILARINGQVTFPELFDLCFRVTTNESYHCTNDLWFFDDCYFAFSADQLRTLAESIRSHYPKEATRNKTAIVTSSGLAEGMASIWSQMAAVLPYETRTFRSVSEAKGWILGE
jgi:hypothetical protein